MMLSPHRHTSLAPHGAAAGSSATTSHRGVEARELELLATRLDMDCSDDLNLNIESCQSLGDQQRTTRSQPIDEDASAMTDTTSALCTEDTGSFIQVVVKKHHNKKENKEVTRKANLSKSNAVQTSPIASSPIQENQLKGAVKTNATTGNGAGDNLTGPRAAIAAHLEGAPNQSLYMLPHPMLLTAYPPQCMYQPAKTLVDAGTSARSSSSFKKLIRKEFPQRTTASVLQPSNGKTCNAPQVDTQVPANKRWINEALSKFKIKRVQPTEPSPEKIELYYFDRGTCDYYETTDCAPLTIADQLADRAEAHATRFWAEVFGVPFLAVMFVNAFLLQLQRFILSGVVRPLIVGLIQILSDYLMKPTLAVLFNAVIQPPLLFLLNILTSVRDLSEPVAECIGNFLKPVERILASIKLVQVTNNNEKCCHDV